MQQVSDPGCFSLPALIIRTISDQVQMAMGAGASGVLGGRAFWKEYFLNDGAEAQSHFAGTTATKRGSDVNVVVREHASPWYWRIP